MAAETPLLNRIHSPKDIKGLSREELEQLAAEIRAFMVESVAATGGHLAPSLGVVELTLALHSVFDSPKDKIIWDVGHQCYAHKIITGRADVFSTMRQYRGISGFPKKSESEHDIVDTGHSSTSISFAVGISEAMKLTGKEGKAIAVIGDGAIASGIAYEALNHAGHMKSNVLVVLNDNEMSISPSVGAFASHLGRIRLDARYRKAEEGFEDDVKNIPRIGAKVYELGKHIKSSIKQMVVPSMIFEELGFTYVGPIDGHNIELLQRNLLLAKEIKTPVLLHVVTKKGRGYKPAEENPDTFHGTSPFDVATGETLSHGKTPPSYTKVFGDTLVEIARRDDRITAITAAMKSGTGLDSFAAEFPDRFYDVGIAEQHAVAFASAQAMAGMKPVAAIYSTFLQRAYDQVIHDVCLQGQAVVLAVDRAGIVGEDGPTHHGVFDLSFLMPVPGITVMAPKDEDELRHMLNTALTLHGPVALRYPRRDGLGVDISSALRILPIGKSETLRTGGDVALIAIGTMVASAMDAADRLVEKGVEATVINARFAKPMDEEAIITAAGNHRLLVTIEENALSGGFGEHVLEVLAGAGIKPDILTLGLPDGFIEHGPIPKLLELYGLSPAKIAAATYKKLNESPGNGLAAGGKLIKTLRKAIKTGMNGINGKDPARRASRR
jgi:1-deoxy-D-xylulose-5-phosphate synthase